MLAGNITVCPILGNWLSLLHIISCSNHCVLAIAHCDYHSDVEDELNLSNGDMVAILNAEGDQWYAYSRTSGKKGFIPNNFVLEHLESYE